MVRFEKAVDISEGGMFAIYALTRCVPIRGLFVRTLPRRYVHYPAHPRMQLRSLSMKPVDSRVVAKQVYNFASSQAPLAPLVKEALGVIDDAIESFG